MEIRPDEFSSKYIKTGGSSEQKLSSKIALKLVQAEEDICYSTLEQCRSGMVPAAELHQLN